MTSLLPFVAGFLRRVQLRTLFLLVAMPAVLFSTLAPADAAVTAEPAPSPPRIAIIIDDLGYDRRAGERIAALPGAVTVSVLPFTPHGQHLAARAHRAGKEVMLHAPMANLGNHRLGPGGLTAQMDRLTFDATLRANLAAVPHVRGVNNHMGSLLTQRREPMTWLMQRLREQGLYFVDSRTSAATLAAEVAREQALPVLSRDVFLEPQGDLDLLPQQFAQLLRLARQRGQAVAIGHPYPATVEFLEWALPYLDALGVELVPLSALLPRQPWQLVSGEPPSPAEKM